MKPFTYVVPKSLAEASEAALLRYVEAGSEAPQDSGSQPES